MAYLYYRGFTFSIALCLLLGSVLPAIAGEAGLFGTVLRPPAESAPTPKADRYRSRSISDPTKPKNNCNCTPGLYSVVYLTGDNLPPLTIPKEKPKIAQKNTMFEPSVLAVPVGATVEFPNLDPFFHNVFSYSKTKKFDLGRYPKGESETVTFDKPGIVQVFCEIHYSMRAYVHVLTTPLFAVSDERGNFKIPNVPQGTYTLHIWQENLPELTQPLKITADSTFIEIQ